MSIRHVTELVCDKCGASIRAEINGPFILSSEYFARYVGTCKGWRGYEDGDRCPECVSEVEGDLAEIVMDV